MDYHEKGQDKSEESLEADPNIKVAFHVLKHFVALLKNFQNFEQPCDLYQFVHFANSCNSHNLIEVISSKKDVKGNNSKKVDCKPSFDVEFGYNFPILYLIEFFVIVG
jgi:hypothetical protein